jgi:hypothetical protein
MLPCDETLRLQAATLTRAVTNAISSTASERRPGVKVLRVLLRLATERMLRAEAELTELKTQAALGPTRQ